ncbi:MAG: hypothetical protein M3Y56_14815 [Armatimonadota bacterium]|nr:hypothetical protein [Armatimonadota bacterium]
MMRPTLVKLPVLNKRPLWRRIACYLILVIAVAVAVGAAAFIWSCRRYESVSGDHVEVSLGCIPDISDGQRSALQTLSVEIRKHATANSFTIQWRDAWIIVDPPDEWELYYNRHDQRISYGSCCGENWMPVTATMIHAVAGHRGLLSEFEKYGAQEGP